MKYSEWVETYKPIQNVFRTYGDQMGFETYGEEVEFVDLQNPHHIWTWVDGDGESGIVAGRAWVNRLEYYITENPWETGSEYILISTETDCSCSNEEEEPDPKCERCEGSGYTTTYAE